MGVFKMPYTFDVSQQAARKRKNSRVMRRWSVDSPRIILNPRKRRITLNISGERFETYEETLERFPTTLLGSPQKRAPYFNSDRCEYYLPRDKAAFDCILFYYQSYGMLTVPDEQFVPEDVFRKEIAFYELGKAATRQLPIDFDVDFDLRPESQSQQASTLLRMWNTLENPRASFHGKILGAWFLFVMVVTMLVKVLETLPEFRQMYQLELCCEKTENGTSQLLYTDNARSVAQMWFFLSLSCSLCLGLEFLVRFITAPDKLKYCFFPLGIIDFLSFAPHFVLIAIDSSMMLSPDHYPLRNVLEFLQFLCVFKIYRYSTGLQVFFKSIRSSLSELGLLLYCVLISVILFGGLVFYCEDGKNGFTSIPATFWYSIITMTTVGYGDMVTATLMGKIFSVCCAIIGVTSLLALPTTVVVNNFNKYYQAKVRRIKELEHQASDGKESADHDPRPFSLH